MKHLTVIAGMALALAACDVEAGRVTFGDIPADTRLEGVWSGMTQISTAQDNSAFSFPVVLQLDRSDRFTLITANYPAAYDDQWDRTCSGIYTRSGNTITFYPRYSCRALPLSRYTLGRTLPDGITMEANTNDIPSSMGNYASIRVLMQLERE